MVLRAPPLVDGFPLLTGTSLRSGLSCPRYSLIIISIIIRQLWKTKETIQHYHCIVLAHTHRHRKIEMEVISISHGL